MKMHYDSRNDHIYCNDAYAVKDILKGYGFRWNGMNKVWFIVRPKNGMELGNLLADVFAETKMSYFDFCDFLNGLMEHIGSDIQMDEAHTAKFQAAAVATGEAC